MDSPPDADAAHAAVATTLSGLSDAWRSRRYEDVASYFDADAVMIVPGFSGRVQGRDVLVDGYREFMDRSTLTHYVEQPPVIDIFGDTAVASYRWEMTWVTREVENKASGHDLFVLQGSEIGGRQSWRAVWRTMTFDSGP